MPCQACDGLSWGRAWAGAIILKSLLYSRVRSPLQLLHTVDGRDRRSAGRHGLAPRYRSFVPCFVHRWPARPKTAVFRLFRRRRSRRISENIISTQTKRYALIEHDTESPVDTAPTPQPLPQSSRTPRMRHALRLSQARELTCGRRCGLSRRRTRGARTRARTSGCA